jgi:hypothetical protein
LHRVIRDAFVFKLLASGFNDIAYIIGDDSLLFPSARQGLIIIWAVTGEIDSELKLAPGASVSESAAAGPHERPGNALLTA